jgi:hypothetical protein
MKTHTLIFLLVLALLPISAGGQVPTAPGFQDDLLDHLRGSWIATGESSSRPATFLIHSEWILNHQFFHVSQKQEETGAAGSFKFEADFYIGRDEAQKQYVAHVLTVFGGADSPIGTGRRDGNDLILSFPRPQGEIVYHFAWQPASNDWRLTALNKGKVFVDLTVKRTADPASAK